MADLDHLDAPHMKSKEGMRVVHHFPAGSAPRVHQIPACGKIISAAWRNGFSEIGVYVEHWGHPSKVPMTVVVVGTGQDFVHPGLDHIATLTSEDGRLVWHVYGGIDRG